MSSKNSKIYLSSNDIIDRMCEKTGLNKKQIAAQVFDITAQALSGQLQRNKIDLHKILNWAIKENINPTWLLLGNQADGPVNEMTNDERKWYQEQINNLKAEIKELKMKLEGKVETPDETLL